MKSRPGFFSVIIVICLIVSAIPATALAAPEEEHGQIFTGSNGDGYTPYNLQWDNAEAGIISFDLQKPASAYWSDMVSTGFIVKVFRNGEAVGTSGGISATENSNVTHGTSDISEHMAEPGTYFFTVYFTDGYSTMKSSWGEISKSTEYVKGQGSGAAASRVIGNTNESPNGDGYTPYNLRWIEPSEGIIAFDKQSGENKYTFDIIVYKDGQLMGGQNEQDGSEANRVDISSFLNEPGIYYFTVQYLSEEDTYMDNSAFGGGISTGYGKMGEVARSPEYNYGNVPTTAPASENTTPEPTSLATTPNASSVAANPTSSSVLIDGGNVAFDAYNINGSNYFKLRDLAYALNGTSVQFEVGWDGSKNAINLLTGQPYSGANEMQARGSGEKSAVPTASPIYVDGSEVTLTAYNIEGNNYFMLRELGDILGFEVDWDGESNSIMISTGAAAEIRYEDTAVGGEFSLAQYIDTINQHLSANGYGKMIVDETLSQFAQKQVDLYVSKYDAPGNVYGEGDNAGYMPIWGHNVPKGVSPMYGLQEFSPDQLNNIDFIDEKDFYIGIGYGEMSEFNIIHIIGYSPYR